MTSPDQAPGRPPGAGVPTRDPGQAFGRSRGAGVPTRDPDQVSGRPPSTLPTASAAPRPRLLPGLRRRLRCSRSSVRVRTTTAAALVVAAVLTAAGAGLLGLAHRGLVESAEETALTRARAVAGLTEEGKLLQSIPVPDGQDGILQVVTADGHVRAASENLAGLPPIASFGPAPGRDHAARSLYLALNDDAPADAARPHFRTVAVPARMGDTPVTVYAGTALTTADEARHLILVAMLPGIPLLVLLVAAVTWHSTGRALRPVDAIRTEVAEITDRDLGRRVPVPDSHDEVARLAATMNHTLDRLQDSLDRQRRFVADASHELRSPIAALRAHIEMAQAHPGLLRLPDLQRDVVRLQALATDLLLLARLDTGEAPAHKPVDLTALVTATVHRRTPERVPVRTELEPDAHCTGSPTQLERVLDNLLDNAQRHATASVTVTLHTEPAAAGPGRAVVLTVADDGTGIAPQDRERVFTRFTRLDEARDRDTGGAGLGLAIARSVATAHRGTLTAESPAGTESGSDSGGFLVLRLPGGEQPQDSVPCRNPLPQRGR
ncbi:sensor histidine kinase [Streptomyces sp. NPDC087440]|uniref:sensor histidine kinase n=1 Tax=Streptomyces sp. NPDC087440 TaxID=3365790 RepID=UPI0038176517